MDTEYDGHDGRPDRIPAERTCRTRRAHRAVTDGGTDETQAEQTSAEDDDEPEAAAEENGDGDDETGEETDDAEGGEDESGDEAEGEEREEGEGAERDGEPAQSEDEHGGDAEDVYESDEASGVLHLDLDGLFLDLLGLEVNLNEVTLDVSARPGGNNLLGNLLSQVTGLLDGITSPLGSVTDTLGGAVNRVLGILPGVGTSDESEEGGVVSRIAGWIRGKLTGLVSTLPLEEMIATAVRTVIRQLIEAVESRPDGEEGGERAEPAQAEADG